MAKTKVKLKVPETDYTLLLLDNKCQSNKRLESRRRGAQYFAKIMFQKVRKILFYWNLILNIVSIIYH